MDRNAAIEILAGVLGRQPGSAFTRQLPAFRIDEFRRQRAILYQDDRADAARLVLSGAADRYTWRSDGEQFLIETVGVGNWMGLPEALSGGPFLADAAAAPHCITATFDLPAVRTLNLRFPETIARILAHGYYPLHGHLRFPSARERIVELLVERGREGGEVSLTQEDIGRLLSLSRETVNRVLRDLEKTGVLKTGRGRITVFASLFAE